MTMRLPLEEQLKLEVRELIDLLRHADSFADLRAVLAAKGLSASETILAGLIDGEDESSYGVILPTNQECVVFEIAPDGRLTRWEVIEHSETLTSAFQAVSVGIAMQRSGEISWPWAWRPASSSIASPHRVGGLDRKRFPSRQSPRPCRIRQLHEAPPLRLMACGCGRGGIPGEGDRACARPGRQRYHPGEGGGDAGDLPVARTMWREPRHAGAA